MTSEGHWSRLKLAVRTQVLSKSPDLWLVSSEGFSLPTYASLLTLHSPLLKTLIPSSFFSSSSSTSSLSVPIPALPLSLLLSLLSEGSVSHSLPFNPLEVLEAAELLGIDIDIHVADETEETSPPPVESEENFGSFLKEDTVAEDSKLGAKLEVIEMEEDGEFQCKSCDYTTTRKGNMRNHNKVHSSNSPLYKCPSGWCMFKTKRKSHMQTHDEAKHKGLRFDCNLCDYQTAYRKDLGRHIEGKHKSGTSAFAWPCEICNFKGFDISELKIHINIRHNKLPKTLYLTS